MNNNNRQDNRTSLLVTVGTRPDAIKLAPLIRAIREDGALDAHVCASRQHRDLLMPALSAFDIEPDSEIDLGDGNPAQADLTAGILQGLDRTLEALRPGWIIVQGDTTTCMAASLAAFYRQVPIAHVEAGLRSGNMHAPWPEEMHRRLTGMLADLHFVPTGSARDNLLREGIEAGSIHVTGNTVVDALQFAERKLHQQPDIRSRLDRDLPSPAAGRPLLLVTLHRRESVDRGLASICQAIGEVAQRHDVEVVFPVHPNPAVREQVYALLDGRPNVHLVEPLDYLAFIYLLQQADLALTDSGGIQEEAPSFGVPLVVARTVTERAEVVDNDCAVLAGTEKEDIVQALERLLGDQALRDRMACTNNPFGDGQASRRILDILKTVTAPGR